MKQYLCIGMVLLSATIHGVMGNDNPPIRGGKPANSVVQEELECDELRLLNGDTVHGILHALDGGGKAALAWQLTANSTPVNFSLTRVAEVVLGDRPREGQRPTSAILTLTNGDVMAGDIVSLDTQSLLLDSWPAGRLTVPRTMVSRIEMGVPAGVPVFSGPIGLDGWACASGAMGDLWRFDRGMLYPTSIQSPRDGYTVAREIADIPDLTRFDFTVYNPRSEPLIFGFFCGVPRDGGQSLAGWRLELSRRSYSLRWNGAFGLSRNCMTVDVADSCRWSEGYGATSTISVMVDTKAGQVVLLINGYWVYEWKDCGMMRGEGNHIVFGGLRNRMRLSGIRVASWDGGDRRPVAVGKPFADRLELLSGDQFTGQLVAVAAGKFKLVTEYAGELEAPLSRLKVACLATSKAVKPPAQPGEVRVRFGDRMSRMALVPGKLSGGMLKGVSGCFGEVSLPLATLSKIEFHPETGTVGGEGND